jgi:hypothetical protein
VALGHYARDKEDDEGTTQNRIGERFYAPQIGGASGIDTRQSRPVIAATDREFGSPGATRSQVLQGEFCEFVSVRQHCGRPATGGPSNFSAAAAL